MPPRCRDVAPGRIAVPWGGLKAVGVRLDLEDAMAWLDRLPVRQAVARAHYRAAVRGVQDIVGRIVPSRSPMPVDRGIFRAGWRAVRTPDGAAIENAAPHAAFVEYGVSAKNVRIGVAAIAALAAWAVRKGLASKADSVRVAFAIGRKLQRTGIFRAGRGMRVLEEFNRTRADAFIREEVARELRSLFDKR